MTFKDRATQIIELLSTILTLVALAMGLLCMETTFVDRTRPTLRAAHALRPAQFPNHRKALCIINQLLEVDHATILSDAIHLLEIS